MYNPNVAVNNGKQIKNKLSIGLILFFSIFLSIGLGVIFLGIKEGIDSIAYKSQGVTTKGQVIDIIRKKSDDGYTYSPLIEFSDSGQSYQFENSISSSSTSYYKGESVDVIYMPDNPRKARINSFFGFWGSMIFMSIFGSIFALVGGGMIYGVISQYLVRGRLIKSGQRIYAQFECVDFIKRDKGSDYWLIKSSWKNPRDGKIYSFESDPLSFNPERYFSEAQVPVLIDPEDPKNYMLDSSALPISSD